MDDKPLFQIIFVPLHPDSNSKSELLDMMKKYILLWLSVFTTMAASGQWSTLNDQQPMNGQWSMVNGSMADSLPWPQNVRARLDSLVGLPMFETSTVGLMVYDLSADSVLYCHNHRVLLRPASTMKLLTAITAIDLLGGNYRLNTSLYYKGTISNRTLRGTLYCVGGMDPLFDGNDMRAFANELRQLGVDTIRGTIVADCTMKDTLRLGEGWCWDDRNPILSPLLVSRKANFTERLVSELAAQHVEVDSIRLTTGRMPGDARFICSRTHTLQQVLVPMMKESDNLFAESLFYQIAAGSGKRPATAKGSRAVMQQLIRRMGLNPEVYRIADGSGLSLYNYLSAELEVTFLRYAWQHWQVYNLLYPSLPIAGVDGTLQKRMLMPFNAGNVHAKTGTLSGVSALSGYCTAPNGHVLCFSTINQGVMRASTAHRFQERVCSALTEPSTETDRK